MNELIKDLAVQAGAVMDDGNYLLLCEEEIGKFAELIVRECGKSCTVKEDKDDMFHKFGIKYFGVDE